MNRDDIIRMAEEAEINLLFKGHPEHPERDRNDEIIFTGWVNHRTLRRFAALVAAAEREALKEERRKDMFEICSLRESEESLREENGRLREQLRLANIDALNEAAKNDSLDRENERLQIDGDRYRWVCDYALAIDLAADPDNFVQIWVGTDPARVLRGKTLDDAIDEAMKQAALRREEP